MKSWGNSLAARQSRVTKTADAASRNQQLHARLRQVRYYLALGVLNYRSNRNRQQQILTTCTIAEVARSRASRICHSVWPVVVVQQRCGVVVGDQGNGAAITTVSAIRAR